MKDWKYALYLALAVGLFLAVKLTSPKQYDWSVTFSPELKDPYGAYALNKLLPSLFPGQPIEHSYRTLYEIKDSLKQSGSILIMASTLTCDEEDTRSLLNYIAGGGSAFIAASHFYGKLQDTLKIKMSDSFLQTPSYWNGRDSTSLMFTNPNLDTTARFFFKRDNVYNYFRSFDTTRTSVVARNENGKPVSILIKWGKGNLILNSTPLVFTNIYLLSGNNHEFVSNSLSYLPQQPLQWTEYYHLGRMESRTPLRFILSREPLRWAYYLTIISLLVFMVFEMKRRQRIIPVVVPFENSSIKFASTISSLYYQNKDHKNIAEKKILFLFEQIRTRYLLSTTKIDGAFTEALIKKSGKSPEEVTKLMKMIEYIRSQPRISAQSLIALNDQIEKFNEVK